MPPKEGSKVRLIGLKNPDLNGKIGHINSYSSDGERVMISLVDGRQGLVKVKPRQIEAIGDPQENGGRSGPHLRNSSRGQLGRSISRDHNNDSNNSNNLRSRHTQGFGTSNRNSMAMETEAGDNFRDSTSNGGDSQVEIMDTLRSADAMFELADTSGDGVISQDEFEFYMKKHTHHDDAMIRECFFTIDVDRNGNVTRDEVRSAFIEKRREAKGGDYSVSKKNLEDDLLAAARDADELFDKADFNGSGTLSKREFEMYMKRNTSHSGATIDRLFDQMDSDRNGFITKDEVRKAYLNNQKGEEKETLADILGLEDDDMAEIEDDVYNMFFLGKTCSHSCWFAIMTFVLKLVLIIIIAVDLFTTGIFPDPSEVSTMVKTTQFLLLPVNVAVQEELITTFFVYANLKWSKELLELHPGATKRKYHYANIMRFLDGLSFLMINTTLLLQATNVIGAFLNFAALQFLSSIDNVALRLARDGYLTEDLETVAGDVLLMKLPKNHDGTTQVLDSVLLTILYVITLIAWILFMFVL